MKMKRILILLIVLCLSVFALSACTDDEGQGTNNLPSEGSVADMRIKLTVGNSEIFVALVDNSATRDLVARLNEGSITLNFSDFGGSEKIAYPNPALDVSNVDGCNPQVGDLTIYTPWGNPAAFYRDTSGYSSSLVLVGHIENDGIDILASQSGEFVAIMELAI